MGEWVEVDPEDLAVLIEDWERSASYTTDSDELDRVCDAVDRLREACGRG